MSILTTIEQLHEQGIFSDLDVEFTKFLATLADTVNDNILLGTVLTSYFTSQGHICLNLVAQAEQIFPPASELSSYRLNCPSLTVWIDSLQNHPLVGQPGDYTPLILDHQRLYLYRYWDYEQQLVNHIYRRLNRLATVNRELLEQGLSRLFPNTPLANTVITDRQQLAVLTAIWRKFCVISGGPGTGKTFIIVKILALLLEQNPQLTIALAAPTGKAAVRLQTMVTQAIQALPCVPSIKAAIPQQAQTIHRLLGNQVDTPYFHGHAGNMLPYDVVIIDEASMIDLSLMTKLAQAISPSAHWILLGDKDQLASVEAGTILGDLCEETTLEIFDPTANAPTALEHHLVLLDKNYRFGERSGIWALAQAVKAGQSEKALAILKTEAYPDVQWHHLGLQETVPLILIEQIVEHLANCLAVTDPTKFLQQFDQARILCAARRGPLGIETVNRQLEAALSRKGLIRPRSRWYHGRPIMITRNDYTLRLFNGDVGVIFRAGDNDELQAFFPTAEGQLRAFWPNRLPEHETVYALTIHKSQGSEFDNVFILLPTQSSTWLTRELIYTAITRARQSVNLWANERILKEAIARKINRASGLREALQRKIDSTAMECKVS